MSEKIYQWSEFVKENGIDGQYVIRADSIEEFKRAHTAMKQALGLEAPIVTPNPVATVVEPPHPAETQGVKACEMHLEPMVKELSKTKTNKDGSPKAYYSHKDAHGNRCFGQGFKT